MNSNNRRQHPRSETDHTAILSYRGNILTDCRIRNYSKGGLYLEKNTGDFNALVSLANSKPGVPSIKQAKIRIPRENSNEPAFTVAVRLCYLSDTGVGIAFLQENAEIFNYFQNYKFETTKHNETVKNLSRGATRSPQQIELVLQPIIKACQRYLKRYMPAFFIECENRLPDEADMSLLNSMKTDIFHAQTALRDKKNAIISSQLTNLNTKFTQIKEQSSSLEANKPQASISQEMDIINKDEFEEWVIIVGLGRSVEAEIPALLLMLEMGLTSLVKRAINSDTNPISPAYLLWSLSSSLVNLDIELPVRRIIYGIFKETVMNHIEELYTEVGNIFERHGVDTNVVSIRSRVENRPQQPADDIKPARSKNRSVMSTLSSLISSVWPGREKENGPIQDRRAANNNEIISSLNSLNRVGDRPIADLIDQSLAKKGGRYGAVKMNRESRETISTTEQLLNVMQQDNYLGRGLQNLLHGLEIPIIREVIENPRLLDDANHPARRLLESIDKLAPYSSSDNIEEPLQQIIEQLNNAPADQSHNNLVEATHKIESLLSRKRELFDRNLSLVLESSMQVDLLDRSRDIINRLLMQRLENRSVSIIVDRLLRLGWPGLLIQSKTSKSTPSKKTKNYLGVLDSLLELYDQNSEPTPIEADKLKSLTTLLEQGFSDYPVHLAKAQELISEIEYSLTEGDTKLRDFIQNRIIIDQSYIQERINEQAPAAEDENSKSAPNTEWGNLIHSIEQGDWVVQQREHSQVRLINLAWKSITRTRFVFVDGNGNKVLDTDGATLAGHFESGKISLLESRELPMVERAVERVLKNSFSRIALESQIDELTGLLNRKAFTVKLDDLLNLSISDGSHHALILLDIDQFALINDICGYKGGDQLLKSVTSILKTYQRENAIIARTGEDEFAILLERTTVNRGYQIAETQRQALEAFKFSWEQQSIPLSVSVGIVSVDNTGISSQSLLKAASSACDLAKQSGRNCCRIFQMSDEEIEQNSQLIKSVPVIEEALEKNRISLHGQLITPLFLNEGDDHYEVLLRLLDENNQQKDPTEFIRAAEKYDRMRSVDRWIIDTFFSWAKKYNKQISEKDGFSLNLSGQSLTDASFKDYIIQHLKEGALPPSKIGFEITETAAIKNIQQINAFIDEIKQFGCKFYLDDFGSGYASYSYLKDLSVDCVKIDGIFVKDMLKEKSSHAMVRSITEIAHYMNKKVIAEYVETEALIIELRQIGVDFAQGYGVGRPQPLNSILKTNAAYA